MKAYKANVYADSTKILTGQCNITFGTVPANETYWIGQGEI